MPVQELPCLTRFVHHHPQVEAAAEEGNTAAGAEEDTEDTFSTTTVLPEGSKRFSLDRQSRWGEKQEVQSMA